MKKMLGQITEIGRKGFRMGLMISPCLNVELMKLLPNGPFSDNKIRLMRNRMYKAYIKGYTEEMLKD